MLQLTRHTDGGLFDRLLNHIDETWDACADETLTEHEQLDSYLADSKRDYAHAPDSGDEAPSPQPSDTSQPADSTRAPNPDAPTPRHWPRNPG